MKIVLINSIIMETLLKCKKLAVFRPTKIMSNLKYLDGLNVYRRKF